MAPIIRTYGKKKTRKKEDKDDTFDKLFRPSEVRSNIFESSSEKEQSQPGCKNDEFRGSTGFTFPSLDFLDISELVSPLGSFECSAQSLKSSKKKNKCLSRVEKSRLKKKNFPVHLKSDITNEASIPSSTPLLFKPRRFRLNELVLVSAIKINPQKKEFQSSPNSGRTMTLKPKNILNCETSVLNQSKDNNIEENLRGHDEPSHFDSPANNQSTEIIIHKTENSQDFFGFSQINIEENFRGFDESSNFYSPGELEGKNKIQEPCEEIIMENQDHSSSFQSKSSIKPLKLISNKLDENLSRSMQNLNISSEKDHKRIVKSSSFDESKTSQKIDKNSPACRISIQHADLTMDSSDIEESVINSADERSCSIRSGQLDEEEYAFHSSDEENVSGFTKLVDSIEVASYKCNSKGDSESAIFSVTQKDTSTNQSGEMSADDCDLYTESEIAKSSDSIEVSKLAYLENASSDLSTSSDKEMTKEEESGTVLVSPTINLKERISSSKLSSSFNQSKSYSTKLKESSYSLDNSASDESELSLESDSELSCESSRSSRKSSLESATNLSKESLEHLRECVSLIKMQDDEDPTSGRSRKSLSKRGTEWECPPSPRRNLFTLAPLFPLPENQEDPGEEDPGGSTTASEDDSHHSGSRRSRARAGQERELEGRSSGEDEGTKNSPVRETSRLRRSRRLAKRKESNSRLNMVVEESDSESTEADVVPQMEHIVLPTGKKYRRSLSIIKRLAEEAIEVLPSTCRGRQYDQSVDAVIKLQSKTGNESPRTSRKSLLIKRQSLLSQCYTSCPSPASGRPSTALITTFIGEDPNVSSRKSFRRLSYSIREDINQTLRKPLKGDVVLEEEEECEGSEEQESSLLIATENTVLESTSSNYSLSSETEPIIDYENLVLRCCQQTGPVSFSDILPDGEWVEDSCKVGEGVYGEVFMIPKNNSKNVFKIIPIEGTMKVNDEKQKTYSELCNELLIAHTLNDLKEDDDNYMTCGFAELVKSSVIKGKYPEPLIKLWNDFDEIKGSENDSPTIFGDDQLFLVFELGNAGIDLESYSFSTAKQGLSVFKQTVCALAVAEACYEFEHRDLHWGNVLVSRTSERSIPFVLNEEKYMILANGVKATIIDFTLSRMTFRSCPVFCDIGQDPDMFIGAGDYQFDVYRDMKTDVKDRWSSFVPKTNVRWLHYLVDKMIDKVRYQRKTAKVHTDSMKILKDIASWILSCENSVEVALRVMNYK